MFSRRRWATGLSHESILSRQDAWIGLLQVLGITAPFILINTQMVSDTCRWACLQCRVENCESVLDAPTTNILTQHPPATPRLCSSFILSMISLVNRALKCCTIKVRVLFPTQSGLSFWSRRMYQGVCNRGLIQWDTPNNKNTLLAVPGGLTHFNCVYTNLSHSKKCCGYIQHSSSVAQCCIVWVCEVWRISNIVFVGLGRAYRDVCAFRAALHVILYQELCNGWSWIVWSFKSGSIMPDF